MLTENKSQDYYANLRNKMDAYVHFVYKLTKSFPKEEMYGSTSQLRRATLSIILNFIEGFARKRMAVKKNFWETSYGSLQESKYLIEFALKESFIVESDCKEALKMADEIGAMLWRALEGLHDSEASK